MTACAVVVRERTHRSRCPCLASGEAPLARGKHPAAPIAFYGPYEALEGGAVGGVAILGFPTMAAARGGR